MENKKRVLFVCTHNSARSQMAETFLNHIYPDKYEAFSAGTKPSKINPYVVEVMKEIGFDLSNNKSKSVNEFINDFFDYVITVCDSAKQECPFFPNGKSFHHKSFDDPSSFEGDKEYILKNTRRIRDEIKSWIQSFFHTP